MNTLYNNNLCKKRPSLYETILREEDEERAIAEDTRVFRFVKPEIVGTWYILGFDKESNKYMCIVDKKGKPSEIGYFSLHELRKINHKQGFQIDKGKFFNSITLDDLRQSNSFVSGS